MARVTLAWYDPGWTETLLHGVLGEFAFSQPEI
jgi:hypothetical protein